ncbi:MAG: alpha-N-arabinofuranosidase [Candidatus Sigynarchaeota archaeon]
MDQQNRHTRVVIHADEQIAHINPNIYGHFAEHLGSLIYDGLWVGPESKIPNDKGIRLDVVNALKKIKVPVVRWPGGCFADDYHWQDGIGPREKRPTRMNLWWGGIETNAFGTHEFFQLCEMLGAEPYICGNVGTGTPREMREWLEYMNVELDTTITRERAKNGAPEPLGVRYFGIGNESWGCGGNMTPQYYANEYARFATFADRMFLVKIASGANADDYDWTRKFFETISGRACGCRQSRTALVNGFAFHYYCGTSGTATDYTVLDWYKLIGKALKIEEIMKRHRMVMDDFDPRRQIMLICDEWGTWHPQMYNVSDPSKRLMQQNTIRDAVVAALTLDIFNRNADIIAMSNIAQMVNVLQAMILTDGPRMLCTPTYHVYEMYKEHQGGVSLPIRIDTGRIAFDREFPDIKSVAGSASRKGKEVTVSLVNVDAKEHSSVGIELRGTRSARLKRWRVLAGNDIHAMNTFDAPDAVQPRDNDVPAGVLELDPASVNVLTFEIE